MTKHNQDAPAIERRTFKIQFRAASDTDSRSVEGYGAVFSSESEELWGFYEVIEPGAFDEADMSDVRALFNHDPSKILARTSSGTLTLSIDDVGLRYAFEMPDTTVGNDLLVSMRRGDISQSSFAFTIREDSWEDLPDGRLLRHIRKVAKVYDVSPVTYPAYVAASATARSYEAHQTESRESGQHEHEAAKLALFIIENQI